MINNRINKIIFFCMLLLTSFTAMADDIDNSTTGNGDVQDVVTAPIDNYLAIVIIAAIGLSFIFLRPKSIKR